MSRAPSAAAYSARVAGLIVLLLALSAGTLYVLFGEPRAGAVEVFGSPLLGRAASRAASIPVGAADPTPGAAADSAEVISADPAPPPAAAPAAAGGAADAAATIPVPAAPAPSSSRPAPDPLARARRLVADASWPAALRIYDELHRRRPADNALALERARVLAWSGDPAAAAHALAELLATRPHDASLRLEQARFLWWAGNLEAADAALTLVFAQEPANREADELRALVRRAAAPSALLARQWLASRDTPLEHLLLARALAREGSPAAAVPHYLVAVRSGEFADSLALEAASIAATADSLDAAAAALEHYLERVPRDREARVRLARVLGWAERPDEARRQYEDLLRDRDELPLRFELARLDAWAGRPSEAETALLAIVEREPRHAAALKLLGDLARWRGDAGAALGFYARARAVEPGLEGLDSATRDAERMRLASDAADPAAAGDAAAWTAAVDAFADTHSFRWLSNRATRSWLGPDRVLALSVHHDVWDGRGPAGLEPGAGYGAELYADFAASPRLHLGASAGARAYGGDARFATWSAAATLRGAGGASTSAEYRRQPALRRSATLTALETDALSDLLQLTHQLNAQRWQLWARAELERLSSSIGASARAAGSLALSREIGAGWSAAATVGGISSDGPSPELAGWGPLFWAPISYFSPALGLGYRIEPRPAWQLRARLAPGYAWIRERDDTARRFRAEHAAVLGAGLESSLKRGRWELDAAADWNGTLQPGYRAAALRFRASYAPRQP